METDLKQPETRELRFGELVALTAAVMALNALAIDMMLPALGLIANELDVADGNQRQWVIGFYIIANGFGQLIFGPLVDRYGRRTVLLWALGGYMIGSLLSVVASSYALLLAARIFQGVATAATRVASIAIVRDMCAGRRMAQVMSLALTIFMAAPILAPGFGQLILFAAPWRGIFIALLIYGAILMTWLMWRLPETLKPQNRKALNPGAIGRSYWDFVRNRTAIGYTLASAFCFGALFGYISASEQIFLELFETGSAFAAYFALIAAALGVATLANARLVVRLGMRRLTHAALLSFVVLSLLHIAIVATIGDSLVIFMMFMMPLFFCIGLIGPNSSAIAMEPMGDNAGAAAGVNGFAGTAGAGFVGSLIGAFYDGSTMPIAMGFFIFGAIAFALIIWTEKGQLFQPHTPDAPSSQ